MTDTITLPRSVVEQAIQALEYHTEQTRPIFNTDSAIDALRAALDAPQGEPVGRIVSSGPLLDLPCFEWISADHSMRCKTGDLLYTTPHRSQRRRWSR